MPNAPYKQSRVKKLSPTEAAYLAGFLDCDGSITKSGEKYYVLFIQTNERVLNQVKKMLGMEFLRIAWQESKGSNLIKYKDRGVKKPHHIYISAQLEVLDLLQQLEPYLIKKNKKAREAIEAITETYGPFTMKLRGL